MKTTENTEATETTEASCDNTTSTREILIKGALIPAMGLIVTQVVPWGVKKVAERVHARREAKANPEPNTETND